MISRVEEAVNFAGVDARIIIVDKLEESLYTKLNS